MPDADPRATHVEERGFKMPLLKLDQLEQVDRACRAAIIAHYASLAESCAIEGPARFGLLAQHVPAQVDLQQVYDFLFTAAGQRCVFKLSAPERADELAAAYAGTDAFNLALALCGYAMRLQPDQVAALLADAAKRSVGIEGSEASPPGLGATS